MARVRRYDHPNVIIRREQSARGAAGSTGTNAVMMNYQKTRLVAAHARVVTAGTHTSNHAYTINAGTDSIGVLVVGTQAAEFSTSVSVGSTIAALTPLGAVKGNESTGVVDWTWEYEVLGDAVLTGD